jgi:hypothetical protein
MGRAHELPSVEAFRASIGAHGLDEELALAEAGMFLGLKTVTVRAYIENYVRRGHRWGPAWARYNRGVRMSLEVAVASDGSWRLCYGDLVRYLERTAPMVPPAPEETGAARQARVRAERRMGRRILDLGGP